MIYEESEIKDILNCEHCFHVYDEYHPPRILLCCQKTICFKCVQLIERQAKNNKYKCISCNKESTIPEDGFIVNNALAKLISKKPTEIPRGPEAEKLKQNLRDLENQVKKLLFDMDNGEYLITEDCRELRRQVQLAKEEKIEAINQNCDALLLKIDANEQKCLCKYKEMDESKKKANELIKSVNKTIQIQNAYLRQLKIDDKDIIASNQKIDELRTQIEKERKNMKKVMFDNQTMKFEANKATINEPFLGRLIYQNIELSVTIYIYFT